jgi:hypothetical protein
MLADDRPGDLVVPEDILQTTLADICEQALRRAREGCA